MEPLLLSSPPTSLKNWQFQTEWFQSNIFTTQTKIFAPAAGARRVRVRAARGPRLFLQRNIIAVSVGPGCCCWLLARPRHKKVWNVCVMWCDVCSQSWSDSDMSEVFYYMFRCHHHVSLWLQLKPFHLTKRDAIDLKRSHSSGLRTVSNIVYMSGSLWSWHRYSSSAQINGGNTVNIPRTRVQITNITSPSHEGSSEPHTFTCTLVSSSRLSSRFKSHESFMTWIPMLIYLLTSFV